jgi:hypothetical protein
MLSSIACSGGQIAYLTGGVDYVLITWISWRRGIASALPFYSTWKGTLLEREPPGVTTWTVPVVAPVGTVVAIPQGWTTVNGAGVPLNVTLVAPFRFDPVILAIHDFLPDLHRPSTRTPSRSWWCRA